MKESFQAGFEQASALFMTFVPKLLLAVVIITVGYFIGKLICRGLSAVLDRVGFNRLVERGGIKRSLQRSGWEASAILGRLVFYIVMLFVLQLAFGLFGPNPISNILTQIIDFLPNVFAAIVITVLAAAIANGARQMIDAALGGLSYGKWLARGAGAAILFLGIMAALSQLGIAPAIINGLFYAVLAAVVGVVIVAVGGGGIAPMRQRWEKALGLVEQEAPRIREASKGAGERIQARARQWTDQPEGGFPSRRMEEVPPPIRR